MERKLFLIIVSLPVILFSCYQDIDMEKYRPEPDLVLNGVIAADIFLSDALARRAKNFLLIQGFMKLSEMPE